MDDKIRILHIVTTMNIGGLENRLMDIYKSIYNDNFQFDFYTLRLDKGHYDKEISEMGGNVYYNEPINIFNINKTKNRFNEFLIIHTEYDIIHVHLNQWCGFFLDVAKKRGISNRIAHSRTAIEGFSISILVKNYLKKNILKFSTLNLAVSLKAAYWLFGKKATNDNRVIIIPNGINTSKYIFDNNQRSIIRDQYGFRDNKIYIHVGNIKKEKNHLFLLKVFRRIFDIDNKSILFIIGKDNLKGKIKKYTKKLGLSGSVIFIEYTNNITSYLSASDVFLFPSKYEGFPGSVLEAIANGLPAIVSNKVSDEISSFNNIRLLPIEKKSITAWVDSSINLNRDMEKPDYGCIDLIKMGYDISSVVMIYQKLYTNLLDIECIN